MRIASRALPGELPVMGGLVESGLTNVPATDADIAGYFGMRVSVWLGAYPGFPDSPQLQLQWFTDQARVAGAARAAMGIDNADPSTWGDWVADVQRPAPALRGRSQLRLADATALIATGCPATAAGGPRAVPAPVADTTAPALELLGRRAPHTRPPATSRRAGGSCGSSDRRAAQASPAEAISRRAAGRLSSVSRPIARSTPAVLAKRMSR